MIELIVIVGESHLASCLAMKLGSTKTQQLKQKYGISYVFILHFYIILIHCKDFQILLKNTALKIK